MQLNDVLEQNKPGWSESLGHSLESLPWLEVLAAEKGIMERQGIQVTDLRHFITGPILRADKAVSLPTFLPTRSLRQALRGLSTVFVTVENLPRLDHLRI